MTERKQGKRSGATGDAGESTPREVPRREEAHRKLFTAGEAVMVIISEMESTVPRFVEGRVLEEDPGGLLLELFDPDEDADFSAQYVPFCRVESVLVLEKRSAEEMEKQRFQRTVRRQKVLDELDQIFFSMTEQKGLYSRSAPPEGEEEELAERPEEPDLE